METKYFKDNTDIYEGTKIDPTEVITNLTKEKQEKAAKLAEIKAQRDNMQASLNALQSEIDALEAEVTSYDTSIPAKKAELENMGVVFKEEVVEEAV